MKPLLIALSLAVVPALTFAGDGTTIVFHTRALSLQPMSVTALLFNAIVAAVVWGVRAIRR